MLLALHTSTSTLLELASRAQGFHASIHRRLHIAIPPVRLKTFVAPYLHTSTPTRQQRRLLELYTSMPPRSYTSIESPVLDTSIPPCRYARIVASWLQSSKAPYLHVASTSPCQQRAARPPELYASTSTRQHRVSRALCIYTSCLHSCIALPALHAYILSRLCAGSEPPDL